MPKGTEAFVIWTPIHWELDQHRGVTSDSPLTNHAWVWLVLYSTNYPWNSKSYTPGILMNIQDYRKEKKSNAMQTTWLTHALLRMVRVDDGASRIRTFLFGPRGMQGVSVTSSFSSIFHRIRGHRDQIRHSYITAAISLPKQDCSLQDIFHISSSLQCSCCKDLWPDGAFTKYKVK